MVVGPWTSLVGAVGQGGVDELGRDASSLSDHSTGASNREASSVAQVSSQTITAAEVFGARLAAA